MKKSINKYFPPQKLVALGLLLVTLAVNVSMPLFRVYAIEAHLNNAQTSLVLAAYIMGMLPCYVFLGGISDKMGRKPVLLMSVAFSLLSTVNITLFPDIYALFFSRIFQGIALGLSMGTGTAYMSEILHEEPNAPAKAANLASLSTAIGFSGGALSTTLWLLYDFSLRPITYPILIGITIIGFLLMLSLPKIKPIGGNIIRLPYFPKGSFPINMSIAICWAAAGVVIAIIPAQLAKFNLTAYAGFCLMFINWTGAFLQPFIRDKDPLKSVEIGFVLIPFGFLIVILGSYWGLLWVILMGTFFIGMAAYGFSYLGGLALIATLGGVQKARAVSGYMFYGYIGFGIPAIFLGYLADNFGIINALLFFEVAIVALSIYLLLALRRHHLHHFHHPQD